MLIISHNELQVFDAIKCNITRTNDRLSVDQQRFLSDFLLTIEDLLAEIREDWVNLDNELKCSREQNSDRPWFLYISTLWLRTRLRLLANELNEQEQMVCMCKSMLSVFRLLPPEIITIVLKNVAISGDASPRTICNVSSYWRRVSQQFPTSWAFEHVRLFNSNDGLLVCKLHGGHRASPDDKLSSKLRELEEIVPLLPLVAKIDIIGDVLCRKLIALPDNILSDHLLNLELQLFDEVKLERQVIALRAAKRLQSVQIDGFKAANLFRHLAIPCKNLTVMWICTSLSGWGPLSFLRQCVNLQELTLCQNTCSDRDKFGHHLAYGSQWFVTLPRLTKLRIMTDMTPIQNVLAVLDVPALRSFEFMCRRSKFISIPSHIQSSLSRIHSLYISIGRLQASGFLRVISLCASLSSLTVSFTYASLTNARSLLEEMASGTSQIPPIKRFTGVFIHYLQLSDEVLTSLCNLLNLWMLDTLRREALTNVVITFDRNNFSDVDIATRWRPWIKKVQDRIETWTECSDIFDFSSDGLITAPPFPLHP
ncbi:hypothetical protein H0H93_003872 [Arthromyces matolae]|nr:hypothetical protein H0H93_003872 [Arthromyces matolae]